MGAKAVIGLDVVDDRLAMARRLGALHTVNVLRTDPVSAVRDLTDGHMADLVVEAVGKEETINLCPGAHPDGTRPTLVPACARSHRPGPPGSLGPDYAPYPLSRDP